MYKSAWWTTPIWEVDTGFSTEFNQGVLDEVYGIAKNIEQGIDTNPYDSLWDYQTPRLAMLREYILNQANKAINGNINEATELNISLKHVMGWVNVLGHNQGIEAHSHNDCSLVATYYLKTPKDCGDLVVLDTSTIIADDGSFINSHESTLKHLRFTPIESKLVLLPGYAMHEVQRNKSNDLRISLSTDMQQVIDNTAPNAMVVKSWCNSWLKIRE